ncbi:MAG: cyclodeaminase/cyclohydrolase family protein [Lachnospiraceae bacterium]|nr:cyclodeaminase/cyclohydrolase family protein [Lachnospiraceae bacterium]
MKFVEYSCKEFVEVLASKAPVPGGGGASGLIGAVGIALGNMAGNLTVGKKKYADVEAEVIDLNERAQKLQQELLALVEEDAKVFEPLSKAYGMPKETPEQQEEKARVMEAALKEACLVPLQIMRKCCEAIEIIADYSSKVSVLAISDVGVGATTCKAALLGASLNVFINTKSMQNKTLAEEFSKEAEDMIAKYGVLADEVFAKVEKGLK